MCVCLDFCLLSFLAFSFGSELKQIEMIVSRDCADLDFFFFF